MQTKYILIILAAIILVLGSIYFLTNDRPANINPNISNSSPSISANKKSIDADGKVLLSVDNDTIFNWFKTESQLCDESNINNTPDRKMFCENKASFKDLTSFSSIVVSPDKNYIGFNLEYEGQKPDKVVGIFLRSTNRVHLLTNYYLGNEFISFSPNGLNFVYQGSCFEGMCGLFIKDSETLDDKGSLNNPQFLDQRNETAVFVRWIADNQLEYKLGTELKKYSISTSAEVVKPDAPGPFVADAVRNLMPKTLKVGQNTITAEVRGYMFFEAETQLKLYDGKKEIDIGKRSDGLPNTVVTAQGEWMTTGYVPVSQVINIPASVKGKILTIRFIANDPSDNARPRYWGTIIKVE